MIPLLDVSTGTHTYKSMTTRNTPITKLALLNKGGNRGLQNFLGGGGTYTYILVRLKVIVRTDKLTYPYFS